MGWRWSGARWRGYGAAILAVVVAGAVRVVLLGALETRAPWLTFYPAVMIAGLYGGFGAGVMATTLTLLAIFVGWPAFGDQPFIADSADLLGASVFAFNGVLISGITEAMRRARARTRRAEEEALAASLAQSELIARDVSERAEAERRIKEYLDIAVDPLTVSRAIRDTDSGEIVDFEAVYSNDPATQVVGPSFAAVGSRLSAQSAELYRERLTLWSGVVTSGRPVDYEASLPNATLGERDLAVRITKVGDGVAVAFRDVSAAKQLQRALESARAQAERARLAAESARAEAERANRSKTEFLSRMSHELRTPLNAVIGFAQLLELERLPDGQRDSVEHILRGGRHLLELINEVLDISRIEAGTLTTSPEPVRIADAVTDAVALIAPLAEDRGIRVFVEDGDHHVLADRQRLKQVLLNLLSNAVKFNRPGGAITVSVSEAAPEHIRVAVRDEGGGIPAAMRGRVFAPFDRLDVEATGVEGTGLGLALSEALVRQMGGLIGFDSVHGEGATFWIELPSTAPAAEGSEAKRSAAVTLATTGGGARTVLFIEDNLSNLQLVERLFALRTNVRVIPAMLGRLGLDLAREHRPGLILLDLHLPDMAGSEILARLRADPVTRETPIVILSADATPSQQERLLAAGAAAYLTKPIDINEFIGMVDRLLGDGE